MMVPAPPAVIQEVVGDAQPLGGQTAGAGVQVLLHGHEHRRQAVVR